ncbi:uncharacterized protein LOC142317316 [Lycorma delicatula]|uniref:uncharacterized protein LOC142317316 n=1 Tax=Lycorma delicatula TaxID=130591 RepID=UPI003F5126D2
MEKNIRTITSINNQPRKMNERSAKNKLHIIKTKGTEKKVAESGSKQINTDNNQSLCLPSTSKSISPDKHFNKKPILKKHKINLKTKTETAKKIEDNNQPRNVTKISKCEISEDDSNVYSKENIHEEMQIVKTTADLGNDFVVPRTVPQDTVINSDNNQSLCLPSTSKSISPDKHFNKKPILKKQKINPKTKTETAKKIEDNNQPRKVTKILKCEISEDDSNEYSKENIHEEMQIVKTKADLGNDFVVPRTVPQDTVINSEEIIKEATEEIKNEEAEKELPVIIVRDEAEISNVTFSEDIKLNIKNEQTQSSFTSVELQNEPIINQDNDMLNETTNQYLENNQNDEISESLQDVNNQRKCDEKTTKTDNINCQEKNVIKNERKLTLKNSECISPQPSTSGIKSSLKETPKIFTSNSLPFIIHNSKISDSMSEILIYKLGSHSTPRKIRKNKHIHCIPKSNWGTPETNCFRSSQYLTQNIIAKRAINKNFTINKKKIDIIPTALINPVNIKAYNNHGKINQNKKYKDTNNGSSVQNKINKLETQPEIKVKEEIFKKTPVTSLINKFENIILNNAADKHSTDTKKIIVKIQHSAVDDNNSNEKYNKKREITKNSDEIKQSLSTINKFNVFEDEEKEVQSNYAEQKFSSTDENLMATENSIEIKQSLSTNNTFTVFEEEEKEVQSNYAEQKFSSTDENLMATENSIEIKQSLSTNNTFTVFEEEEKEVQSNYAEQKFSPTDENLMATENSIEIKQSLSTNNTFTVFEEEEKEIQLNYAKRKFSFTEDLTASENSIDKNNYKRAKTTEQLISTDETEASININKDNTDSNETNNVFKSISNHDFKSDLSKEKELYNNDFNNFSENKKHHLVTLDKETTDLLPLESLHKETIDLLPLESNESRNDNIIEGKSPVFQFNEKDFPPLEPSVKILLDDIDNFISGQTDFTENDQVYDKKFSSKREDIINENQISFELNEKEEITDEEKETSFNDKLKLTINLNSNYNPGKFITDEKYMKNQDFFVKNEKEEKIDEQETSINDNLKCTINVSSNCDPVKFKTNEDEKNVMKSQEFFVEHREEDVINEQEASFNDKLKLTINVNNTYDPGNFITDTEEDNDTPTASISMLFNIAESITTPPLTYSEYREEFYKIMSLKT